MPTAARDQFGHLPKAARQGAPPWVVYPLVFALAALVGAIVVPIGYAVISYRLSTPAEREVAAQQETDAVSAGPEMPTLGRGEFIVSASDDAEDWPFRGYSTAIVSCRMQQFGSDDGYHLDRPVVTVRLGDTVYGLNGAALGVGGYPDNKPLRKRDQWGQASIGAGLMSDWIERAVKTCPTG